MSFSRMNDTKQGDPREAPSTLVLREHGPNDLREITKLTAIRMGRTLMYADVEAVLEREQEAGRVRIVVDDDDYRNRWWEALGDVHSMPLPLASSGDSESSDLQGDSAEDSR